MISVTISSKYLVIIALITVLAVAGVGAVFAQSPDGNTYTGCLNNGGQIKNVAIGSSPQKPCGPNETQITLVDKALVEALAGDLAILETRIAALEALLEDVSRVDDNIYITGANLHVVNGAGSTESTNGLGNVIIGYNELRGSGDDRSGSHMLVVGSEHNYSSYGGIVVGLRNTTSGPYSSVSGGDTNTASGLCSSVSGGLGNTASGTESSVSGGNDNTASNDLSSVSGGKRNTASGWWSSVSGGDTNTASGLYSSVSGGRLNEASGESSSVSGGDNRSVDGQYDWRAGDLFQDQ